MVRITLGSPIETTPEASCHALAALVSGVSFLVAIGASIPVFLFSDLQGWATLTHLVLPAFALYFLIDAIRHYRKALKAQT